MLKLVTAFIFFLFFLVFLLHFRLLGLVLILNLEITLVYGLDTLRLDEMCFLDRACVDQVITVIFRGKFFLL